MVCRCIYVSSDTQHMDGLQALQMVEQVGVWAYMVKILITIVHKHHTQDYIYILNSSIFVDAKNPAYIP